MDSKVWRSQTDVVVHRAKRMIVEGALGPADQLPVEKDLALQLGVSRGSLREGVSALSILGVLETRQGAGTFVTRLDASLLLAHATLAEHRAIWRALAHRSPDGARVGMANHLLAVEDFLKDRPAADDVISPSPESPASVSLASSPS